MAHTSANPLMEYLLEGLAAEAEQEGKDRLAQTYRRALVSVKKFPLPLKNGMETQQLEYVGPFVAKRLDELLKRVQKQQETSRKIQGKNQRRRRRSANESQPEETTRARSVAACDSSAHHKDKQSQQTQRAATAQQQSEDRQGYRPRKGSAPYAVMMALFVLEQQRIATKENSFSFLNDHHHSDDNNCHSKEDICTQVRLRFGLSLTSDTDRDAKWKSAIRTLIQRGLALRHSSSPSSSSTPSSLGYSLTSSGNNLASLLAIENADTITATTIVTTTTNKDKNKTSYNIRMEGQEEREAKEDEDEEDAALTPTQVLRDRTNIVPSLNKLHSASSRNSTKEKDNAFSYVDADGHRVPTKHEAAIRVHQDNLYYRIVAKNDPSSFFVLSSSSSSSSCSFSSTKSKENVRPIISLYSDDEDEEDEADQVELLLKQACSPPLPLPPAILSPKKKKKASSKAGKNLYTTFYSAWLLEEVAPLSSTLLPRQSASSSSSSSSSALTTNNKKRKTTATSSSTAFYESNATNEQRYLQKRHRATSKFVNETSTTHLLEERQTTTATNEEEEDIGDTPLWLERDEYEVILLLDNRERRTKRDDDNFIQEKLRKSGVKCEVRSLAVGDFVWIARANANGRTKLQRWQQEEDRRKGFMHHLLSQERAEQYEEEFVLSTIVERKKVEDLWASIKDGRYYEQKFRLSRSEIEQVVYLVEGSLSIAHKAMSHLPLGDLLEKALLSTQIHSGFHVKRTNTLKQSIDYLKTVSQHLSRAAARLKVRGEGRRPSFYQWSKSVGKGVNLALKDVWAMQLLEIPGLAGEKVKCIVDLYPTPSHLHQAYLRCESDKERQALFEDMKCGGRRFGASLSTRIYQLYTQKNM
ncbi:Crossover junction endonuclease mus81 [Balamuthia mandrillaris]